MKKIINKSFTIEEVIIGLFIFLMFLGTILSSYLTIIKTHLMTNNKLIALQNLKTSLDRIYSEIKSSEIISATSNSLFFKNTLNCATQTIIFATSSDNIGYLALIKDNSTITLTDTSLIDIKKMNIYLWGKIDTATPVKNVFNENKYFLDSHKLVTLAIEADSLLNKETIKQINVQLTVQQFNSFIDINSCRNR